MKKKNSDSNPYLEEVEKELAEWDRNCVHIYPSHRSYVYALGSLEDIPRDHLQRRKSFDTGEHKLR
jgi:hypothetical protein